MYLAITHNLQRKVKFTFLACILTSSPNGIK